MDEFRTLLNQLWIRREDDRELFYRIRRKLPDLRRTLRDQFGWEVVSTETLIRLVKEPGKADAAFGISDFTEISDYCLLCGVLLMLEDKDDGQRFLLSELTQALSAYVKPYWPELSWERPRTAIFGTNWSAAQLRGGKQRLCIPSGAGSAVREYRPLPLFQCEFSPGYFRLYFAFGF